MGESTYFSPPPPPTTGLQLSGCCHLVETTTRSATVAAGSCGNTRSFLAIRSRPTKAFASERDRPQASGVHRRDVDEDQHGAAARLGAARREARRQSSPRPLENHDLRRLSSLRPHRGALVHRRSDQRRRLPRLRRESARSHAPAGRAGDDGQSGQPQRQGRSARPFAQPAQSCSFSPSTRPISIRSNRFSPSSSTFCASRRRETSRPSSPPPANSSAPTPRTSAPTTLPTPATGKPKFIPL
jgi:hypothetical protein